MMQMTYGQSIGSGEKSADTLKRVKRQMLGRRQRYLVFPKSIFGEPAWEMILELYVSNQEDRILTVTDLCRASFEAQSTALRWIAILEQHEYLSKRQDSCDGRRVFVHATSKLIEAVERIYEARWEPWSRDTDAETSMVGTLQMFYSGIGFVEAGSVVSGTKLIGALTDVRQMQIGRKKRYAIFPRSFLGEPAWEMLLEAYVSKMAGDALAVTDLCVASGQPQSTALRWITILEQHEYLTRSQDPSDRRRTLVHATEKALESIERLFAIHNSENRIPTASSFPNFMD